MALPRSILVAIDFDELSLEALRRAAERARLFECPLRIVHVYSRTAPAPPIPLPGVSALHQEAQQAIGDEARAKVEAFVPQELLEGLEHRVEVLSHPSPGDALCELATQNEIGLLVVGSHRRTGIGRILLGSVAESIVRDAPCDVLVVRS